MLSAAVLIFAPSAQSLPAVASSSMLPTFVKGETVVPQFTNLTPAKLTRGEIVIYATQRTSAQLTTADVTSAITHGQLGLHRVIGLPGETIAYSDADRRWSVNGHILPQRKLGSKRIGDTDYEVYVEELDGQSHQFIEDPRHHDLATLAHLMPMMQKPEVCQIGPASFRCTLPPGYVFVIGDNRENSFYGLVAISNVVATVAQP